MCTPSNTDSRDAGDVDVSLIATSAPDQVLEPYRNTPIAQLLAAQNLGRTIAEPAGPSMVIITCMDHRVMLNVPRRWAFQLRTAGAAVEPVLDNIAFAVAVAGIETIAVIGHTDCAMTRAAEARGQFLDRLVESQQWTAGEAGKAYEHLLSTCAIDDPVAATYQRCALLQRRFPNCLVAPLLYDVDDATLSQIVQS